MRQQPPLTAGAQEIKDGVDDGSQDHANDRLLQRFIPLPEHRSRLLFDLDRTVVTSFGHQEGAEVGYNPGYRGKRSYDPWLCVRPYGQNIQMRGEITVFYEGL
jgi:hypothetical protein